MVTVTKNPIARHRRKAVSAAFRVKSPQIDAVLDRVLKAGGSTFTFPTLTGAEASALMKAAGIVNNHGKLSKHYR